MSLPDLPHRDVGGGYDWITELSGGWYVVALWGTMGWALGRWPLQIICHFDGATFGYCSYTEGDLDIKEFPTREERDHATDEYFVWFNEFHEVESAPRSIKDGRLGPYKG